MIFSYDHKCREIGYQPKSYACLVIKCKRSLSDEDENGTVRNDAMKCEHDLVELLGRKQTRTQALSIPLPWINSNDAWRTMQNAKDDILLAQRKY